MSVRSLPRRYEDNAVLDGPGNTGSGAVEYDSAPFLGAPEADRANKQAALEAQYVCPLHGRATVDACLRVGGLLRLRPPTDALCAGVRVSVCRPSKTRVAPRSNTHSAHPRRRCDLWLQGMVGHDRWCTAKGTCAPRAGGSSGKALPTTGSQATAGARVAPEHVNTSNTSTCPRQAPRAGWRWQLLAMS